MRLVASVMVRNERGRYLEPMLTHLLDFCDEVRVVDDGSTDGSREHAESIRRVEVLAAGGPAMFEDEGAKRQLLFEWKLQGRPDWILAVDADEFIADGETVREAVEHGTSDVLTLTMEEVWRAEPDCLCIRLDGGWMRHDIPALYRAPAESAGDWRIPQVKLAGGREPMHVRQAFAHRRVEATGTEILHFGWANEATRQARYDRYMVADGGRFHASRHLQSILYDDEQVILEGREWPPDLDREELLARANS